MSSQEENERNTLPKPIYVRNFPCPRLVQYDPKTLEAAMDYRPKAGDIILCSYLKTGTTWMQYIIWQILHNKECLPGFQEAAKLFPYLERYGVEMVEKLIVPRCYQTHFPYHLMNINKHSKYIYIHRNPMDTLLSNFHYRMRMYERSFAFDDFFERFMRGDIGYGDYFDHVLSFDLRKDDPHIHMFSYEDLHKDKKGQVLRIAKILGDEYHQALMKDEERMQKLLDMTEFKYMKENVNAEIEFGIGNSRRMLDCKLFRKGVVGEGRKALSSEQIYRLQKKMLTKLKGTDFLSLWSE